VRRAIAGLIAATLWIGPVSAARPLLDQRQWDAYFALSARDVIPSWKPATVRVATYSGAPVDLAVYEADPADVLIAGSSASRAIDTSSRKPLARWQYRPPAGFRFQQNDVTVPIGQREGFFVVEARRGDATEQVWLNHTKLGLLTKEGPLGLAAWFVDLRSGRALGGTHAEFLVGKQLIAKSADRNGIVEWRGGRARFILASSGASKAFVSLLSQSPLPPAIVSVLTDANVVRAGSTLRVFGFVRKRTAAGLRPAVGEVRLTAGAAGRTITSIAAALDAAGAYSADIPIPAGSAPGDYAIIASAAGGVGAAGVRVDAAADIALTIVSNCPCAGQRELTFAVAAARKSFPVAGVPVRVQVVRAPHIAPPSAGDDVPAWGTTEVYDRTVRTEADGRARISLPAPTDGLASTYGIKATAEGASAGARIAAPTAEIALSIRPAAVQADPGEPVAFDIEGFDARGGSPRAGLAVNVRVSHGTSAQTRSVTLDDRGRARVEFRSLPLGTNLAFAEATAAGERALDAAAVSIEPGALVGRVSSAAPDVRITLDKTRYKSGDKIVARARLDGASGDALISLDGARAYEMRVAGAGGGSAEAALDVGDPQGDVRVSAAFIRDGAIVEGSSPVAIDGGGHVRKTTLTIERSALPPGEPAAVQLHDGGLTGGATLALSVAEGSPGSAAFAQAPDLLLSGGTVTQYPASAAPVWHTFVAPARSRASDIYAAERPRRLTTEPPSLGAAAPETLVWRVERDPGGALSVPMPAQKGTYILSVVKVADQGDVGSATITVTVR
jgi:hypothetical protein